MYGMSTQCATGQRRQELLAKLKSRSLMLTKAESDELGPVTNRDLAPISGDSFIDAMLEKQAKETV